MASFPQVSPPKSCTHLPLLSPISARCSAHFILLDFITRKIFGEERISLSSSLCSFLHSPVTSSLLVQNILLSPLFSNTLNLRPSLNVSDQVSHPCNTTGRNIILYILVFKFIDSKLEDKRICTKLQQALSDFNLLLISFLIEFCFVVVFPNISTLPPFQRNYYQFSYFEFVSHSDFET